MTMDKLIKPLVPMIALVLMLAGCQALTGDTLGQNIGTKYR
jgi:hypothetical protein